MIRCNSEADSIVWMKEDEYHTECYVRFFCDCFALEFYIPGHFS